MTKSNGLSGILFERCSPLKEHDLWKKEKYIQQFYMSVAVAYMSTCFRH